MYIKGLGGGFSQMLGWGFRSLFGHPVCDVNQSTSRGDYLAAESLARRPWASLFTPLPLGTDWFISL